MQLTAAIRGRERSLFFLVGTEKAEAPRAASAVI